MRWRVVAKSVHAPRGGVRNCHFHWMFFARTVLPRPDMHLKETNPLEPVALKMTWAGARSPRGVFGARTRVMNNARISMNFTGPDVLNCACTVMVFFPTALIAYAAGDWLARVSPPVHS